MTKRAKSSTLTRSALRRRAAVLAAGMGASVALGTGVALAADDSGSEGFAEGTADSLSSAVTAQAEGQEKAAADKAAEQKKAAAAKAAAKQRAAEDAKKRAVDKAAADRKQRDDAKKLQASWVKPVSGYTKGSTFGLGGSHWSNKHSGQDLVVPTGTSVKSVHGGTVVQAGWGGSYGNNVVVKHGDNTYTQYGHLSELGVSVGQQVGTGAEIGKAGSTGNSTGPHLHFETRTTPDYGSGVDPVAFMKGNGVSL